MNAYKIYIVNQSPNVQTFWSFLAEPEAAIGSEVYANSSYFISVLPNIPGQTNLFQIPLQYKVGVSVFNQTVAEGIHITYTQLLNSNLNQSWKAEFFPPAERRGPVLTPDGTATPSTIDIITNSYDKAAEAPNNWYNSMSFGVGSPSNFMGLTWSPDPSMTYTIKPNVQFYIAVGNYQSDVLVDINAISNTSASVAQSDFDQTLSCTVTYHSDGTWSVTPGKPQNGAVTNLLEAHVALSKAHQSLVQHAISTGAASQVDVAKLSSPVEKRQSTGVEIHHQDDQLVTGTVRIESDLGFGFNDMFSEGIQLTITHRHPQGLAFDFSYRGGASSDIIQQAFRAGTEIWFYE